MVLSVRSLFVTCFLVFATTSVAAAKNPEDVFRGQIILSTKRPPLASKSANEYIATLKKGKTTRFYEDKEKKQWKIFYAAFFRKKLTDLELTVKIYDVSGGQKTMVSSFEQYLDTRGKTSVISQFILERDDVGVNKNLLMVIENRGTILCTGTFSILGEAEKFSGQVDFADEAAGKKDE